MNPTRLAQYMRATAVERGHAERDGPFLIAHDPQTDNPYRNFAIPDDGAAPDADDIGLLLATFGHLDRRARVEYFPDAAPRVEAVLLDAGFVVDRRPSVLACSAGTHVPAPLPPGIEISPVASHADVADSVLTVCEAFGERPPSEEDFARIARMLRDGGGAMLARNEHGEAVGTAQFPAPQAGVTEISGVGVLASSRRRGIGAALTWHVLELAFASGVEVAWLSPEDNDGERIYVRCGFSRVCDALHLHASDADEGGEAGGGGLEPPTSGSKGRRSAD